MKEFLRVSGLILLSAACFTCFGCTSEPEPGDEVVSDCVPGRALSCMCDDGRPGSRLCADEGSYAPCVCLEAPVDAGPDPDTSTEADTDPETDAQEDSGAPDVPDAATMRPDVDEVDPVCPEARAFARVGDTYSRILTVSPDLEVVLDGSASSAADGVDIVGYRWERIVGEADPVLLGEGEMLTLPPEELVTQDIRLTVEDSNGLESCEGSLVTLVGVDTSDLYFELTWDTATDLDIRLYRQRGGAGNQVYYANREAVWPEGSAALEIDDTNGFGPEAIRVTEPGACDWFSVIVEGYRVDTPTNALISGYVQGIQVYQNQFTLDTSRTWVDLFQIHASGTVFANEVEYRTEPLDGYTPAPNSDLVASGLCLEGE